jgi:hypothetical protein
MITDRAQREVACVPCDPGRATVYGEGWQSWSATEAVPVTAAPPRLTELDAWGLETTRQLMVPSAAQPLV